MGFTGWPFPVLTMWVRSEYAGELAVLSTWLSALLPWNVTYAADVAGGSLLFVRFPFFQIRFAFGVPTAGFVRVADPLTSLAFQRGQDLEAAYRLWVAAAAVVAVALLVSVRYYRHESRVESWPVDPVRLLGTLLLGAGGLLAVSTYYLLTRGFPGLPIPLGVAFLILLGGVLLVVDRSETGRDDGE
jgi:hypothetical protein